MSEPNATEDAPRKGRSNAIVTYETIDALNMNVQRALLKIDHLTNKLDETGKNHSDHEHRIRALELSLGQFIAATTARTGTATWVWSAGMGLLAVAISALNYLK